MTHFSAGNLRIDADLIETFEIRSARELVLRMAWGEEILLEGEAMEGFVDFLARLEHEPRALEPVGQAPSTIAGHDTPTWAEGEPGWIAPTPMGA